MKTTAISRIYAFAISAVFATLATVGIAVMMSSSAEYARAEFTSSAAAEPGTQPATTDLTLWQAPAVQTKQVL